MNQLKSKLGLSILLLLITAIGLSAWGLQQSGTSKKEIDQYNAQLRKQLSAQPGVSSPAQNQNSASPTPSSSSNSSSPQKSTPANSSSSSTSQPAPLSDADKQQATQDTLMIKSRLEAYQTTNGYYPGDIEASTFAGDGCSGDSCTSMFSPPPGIHFVYTPSPSGCTTSAHNCQHYTLEAVDSSGNIIAKQTSFN